MSRPIPRRNFLAVCSALSISSLAGCQGSTSALNAGSPTETETEERTKTEERTETGEGTESLGLAVSKSRGSFPSEEETHSGWVHIVSDGESADLTFDVRLCSELGDVEPTLTHAIANEYELRFNASSDFDSITSFSNTTEESQCNSVTRLVGGANVPSSWETLTVAVNNVEIQTIERSGTMPELRPLPDPVQPR